MSGIEWIYSLTSLHRHLHIGVALRLRKFQMYTVQEKAIKSKSSYLPVS